MVTFQETGTLLVNYAASYYIFRGDWQSTPFKSSGFSVEPNGTIYYGLGDHGYTLVSAVADRDGDGVTDTYDNCPSTPNANQADSNGNGIGDACDTATVDTTPDVFSFTDQTGVVLATVTESNTITVTGINSAASITVIGGEYRINGGTWTSVAGTVSNGNTVQLRHTTNGNYFTLTETLLTIGGVSGTFHSRTLDFLVSLYVVCPTSLAVGETATSACAATAFYQNGNSGTVQPIWQAADAYLSVSADGIVTALGEGSTTRFGRIQASYTENGVTVSEYANIEILPAATNSTGGTYTDPKTNLTWMRCAMGQIWTGGTCSGTAATYYYDQARALTNSYGGYSDWRLPTPWELLTILDTNISVPGPMVDSARFPETPKTLFWTGMTASSNDNAWYVSFLEGITSTFAKQSSPFGVRLVRGSRPLGTTTTPTTDFRDNNDGTVTHLITGLTWMRCSLGQTWANGTCSGSSTRQAFAQAVAQTANFAGRSDWRLPTLTELAALVEYSTASPSINTTIFPATPSGRFWSSTLYGGSPYISAQSAAWTVDFESGGTMNQSRGIYYNVRLVSNTSTGSGTPATATATAPSAVSAQANATGGNANLTLSVNLTVDSAVVGQTGSIFLAALFNGQWFLHNGTSWASWSGGALPAYFSGSLPASLSLPVVTNTDVSGLMGVQVYVGYGSDADEMLAANRVLVVHTVR